MNKFKIQVTELQVSEAHVRKLRNLWMSRHSRDIHEYRMPTSPNLGPPNEGTVSVSG